MCLYCHVCGCMWGVTYVWRPEDDVSCHPQLHCTLNMEAGSRTWTCSSPVQVVWLVSLAWECLISISWVLELQAGHQDHPVFIWLLGNWMLVLSLYSRYFPSLNHLPRKAGSFGESYFYFSSLQYTNNILVNNTVHTTVDNVSFSSVLS